MSEQQNNNTNVPPASVPFPGSLTPGWNDPPPVTPAAASATTGNSAMGQRQRLDLRKRVAYPIQCIGGGGGGGVGYNAYGPGSGHIQPPVYTAPPAYNAPPVYVAPTNTNAFSTTTIEQQQQQHQNQQYTTTGWPTQ